MSWILLNVTNIWCKQLKHRYLQNNICFFRSPISPWTGPQWRSLFRAFFSGWSIFSPYQKSALTEPPFKLFWTSTMILAKLVFKQIGEIFLVQNLGHDHLEKCKISCLVGFINEKQVSTLAHFFYFSNSIDRLNQ